MTFYAPALNDGKNIFVFGSNLAGIHGAGAARTAKQYWGAVDGVGFGRTGQAFAIPTKDRQLQTRSLDGIRHDVECFLRYAKHRSNLTFLVTAIGTGLAHLRHAQIAPLFSTTPRNCILPNEWKEFFHD